MTRRSGDKLTAIKPNIQDKTANKIAGMVDIVARAIVKDKKHYLSFKTDEVVFGGGRIKLDQQEIEADYKSLIEAIKKGK